MLDIKIVNYESLPYEIKIQPRLINKGVGKHNAMYILFYHNNEIIYFESTANVGKFESTENILEWIKEISLLTYNLGKLEDTKYIKDVIINLRRQIFNNTEKFAPSINKYEGEISENRQDKLYEERKTYKEQIYKLDPNQVWVFGSNAYGFHGAGAASFAMFGKNIYWKHRDALINGKKLNELNRGDKGWYAIHKQNQKYMEGMYGKSYAIQTVNKPGEKRSIDKDFIHAQIIKLYEFAKNRPDLEFIISYSGNNKNLNGYSDEEMAELFYDHNSIPNNIIFNSNFLKLFKKNKYV